MSSILSEINALFDSLDIPVETGTFSGVPPDEYIVITPLADIFEVHADNRPQAETQEARLSLFSKINYIKRKNQIVKALLNADFTITSRLFIGFETDTDYYHFCIDCSKNYEL